MNRRTGTGINPEDKIDSTTPINDFLDALDLVFDATKGFLLRDLINLLQILASWGYVTEEGEKTYYISTKQSIIEICLLQIKDASKESISNALEFLILKSDNLCKVIGKQIGNDLPVWEYYKRHSRYAIKPLIEIGNFIYWGPYSTYKSGRLWTDRITDCMLPVDLEAPEIKNCLMQEKSIIEKILEDKAADIVQKYTDLCEKNVFLHRREKNQGYPKNIGDFDVLAYFPKENILLNIECKHLQQVFSLKDSRDLKEELFGRKNKFESSHVGKIVLRDIFLKNNKKKIAKTFNWSITDKTRIISIFCSKEPYFWTFAPPFNVPITFLCIDELHNYLSHEIK